MGHANVFVHATSFLYSVVGNTRHRLMTGQSWKCQSLLVLDLLIIGKVCWYMQIAKVHYRFFFRKKLASPGAEAEEAWGRLKCARALARLFLATVGATHHLATPAASRSVGLAGSCWRMRLDACRSICKFLPWRIFLIFFNLFFLFPCQHFSCLLLILARLVIECVTHEVGVPLSDSGRLRGRVWWWSAARMAAMSSDCVLYF